MKKRLQLLAIIVGVFTQVNAQIQFQEVLPLPPINDFDGVYYSAIDFADVDGDTDLDLLITGENTSGQKIAKLYINDGVGNFVVDAGTPFEGVSSGAVSFADIDNDNDQDVLISGSSQLGYISKLYKNNGTGLFTEVIGIPFDGVSNGSINFADIDNDNDLDVLLTGSTSSNLKLAKIYINDGSGNYSFASALDGVYFSGDAKFSDIDNDNDLDVLITGVNNSGSRITKLYTNDSFGNFTLVPGTPFTGLLGGAIGFADVDNDNDQDVLITGTNSSGQPVTNLYLNDGSGNYTLDSFNTFQGISRGSVAFSDVDNDSDQDLLITGDSFGFTMKFYENTGNGVFILNTTVPFDGAFESSIAFVDVDNDNDQDLMLTGLNQLTQRVSKLYRNISVALCTQTTNTLTPTACNTYTVPSGDETYTITGTYMDTIPNVGGCDSVLTINLTINNSTTGTDVISACGSHSWIDGNFYTANNNTATHTLTNSVGCDSVVTLNLTILPLSGNTINVTACDSYTVPSGDETYTVSGNYLDTLVNSLGCDSAIMVNLTITNSTAGSGNVTACDSYTWSANTTTYTTSGSYVATLVNATGCDSTATLNLTITNSTSGTENVTVCDSYTWSANTTTYTTSGSYTAILVNSVGCDSTATLNLTINNSNTGTDVITACDSHTWIDGNTYTANNNSATHTLTNANGCDSVVTLDLTINALPTVTVSSDTLICTGKTTSLTASGASTYNWDNGAGTGASVSVSPTSTTTYTVTGTDVNGCENTVSTTVTVDPCLGLEETTNELGVKIYPNPSTGEFTIDVQTNCEVEIVNAIGEVVLVQKLTSGANAINISTNPNGLYFINVKTKDAVYSKRVVLRK